MADKFKPSANQIAFAKTFLAKLGAPVTNNNIANVSAWEQSESGSAGEPHAGKTGGVWNPLNTVVAPHISNTGAGGTQGNIANYADLQTGAVNSALWFTTNTHPEVKPILAVLRGDFSLESLNATVNVFYGTWGGHITFPGVDPKVIGTLKDSQSGGDTGAATGINDPISSAGGAVVGAAGDAASAAAHAILGPLSTRAFWIRAGEMAIGVSIIVVGIIMLTKNTSVGNAVKGAAGNAVKGAAAAAVVA